MSYQPFIDPEGSPHGEEHDHVAFENQQLSCELPNLHEGLDGGFLSRLSLIDTGFEPLSDPETEAQWGFIPPIGKFVELSATTASVEIKNDYEGERYESFSLPDDVIRKVHDKQEHEILLESDITPDDYDRQAEELGPEHVRAAKLARHLTERLKVALDGRSIEEVSSTGKGGGVQMILMALGNYMQKSGVNWHWRLLDSMDQIATKTKMWHNTYQGVRNPSIEELDESFDQYDEWIAQRAQNLRVPLTDAGLVKLHDPQPHGIVEYLIQWNPDVPIAAWSHIQNRSDLIDEPDSPQRHLWDRMYGKSWRRVDAIGFHPVQSFVPESVMDEQVLFTPATFDTFDDLNRRNLTEQDRQEGRSFLDGRLELSAELKAENKFAKAETDWAQTGIDWNRPIIALIARFCPSKGMEVSMAGYAMARAQMVAEGMPLEKIPQLVIMGNGAPDDTDGESELSRIMDERYEKYPDIKDDVKVGRVPHNDTALNVLMDESKFGLQSSLFEGFETRVSDWTWHAKPVIGSKRGGIPTQIVEGKSGFVADPSDIDLWASHIYDLSTNEKMYEDMCGWADKLGKSYSYLEFSTISSVIRQADLYVQLLEGTFQGSRNRPSKISEILEIYGF